MNFKKWVKSIQTAGYNGARTVYAFIQSFLNILNVQTDQGKALSFCTFTQTEKCYEIERAVEPNKQILCNRPWTTLFCPITTIQASKDQLFANLYVDTTVLDDNFHSLACATPSNDESFYTDTMKRM